MSSSSVQPAALVPLCHNRWTIPLVARLGRTRGERFAVVAHDLGVARQTLRRALDAAIDLGLVVPNPGRGHPLRPEYLLTEAGRAIARAAADVVQATPGSAAELVGKKWTLPVLLAVSEGAERFSEVAAALPDATPRALAKALDDLVAAEWIEREVWDDHPPRPSYRIASVTRRLAHAASTLVAARSA